MESLSRTLMAWQLSLAPAKEVKSSYHNAEILLLVQNELLSSLLLLLLLLHHRSGIMVAQVPEQQLMGRGLLMFKVGRNLRRAWCDGGVQEFGRVLFSGLPQNGQLPATSECRRPSLGSILQNELTFCVYNPGDLGRVLQVKPFRKHGKQATLNIGRVKSYTSTPQQVKDEDR